jgi:hypothetical protein
MFERCRLNLPNNADFVADWDEATNVVRETHTRDTGCEVIMKEVKRYILDAKSASSPNEAEIVTTLREKQRVWVFQLIFNNC